MKEKKSYPTLFKLFGTENDLEGKRAARKLAIQLQDKLSKKVYTSFSKTCGRMCDGTPAAGFHFLVECEDKLSAKQLKTDHWSGDYFHQVSFNQSQRIRSHPKDWNTNLVTAGKGELQALNDFLVGAFDLDLCLVDNTDQESKVTVKEQQVSGDGGLVELRAA